MQARAFHLDLPSRVSVICSSTKDDSTAFCFPLDVIEAILAGESLTLLESVFAMALGVTWLEVAFLEIVDVGADFELEAEAALYPVISTSSSLCSVALLSSLISKKSSTSSLSSSEDSSIGSTGSLDLLLLFPTFVFLVFDLTTGEVVVDFLGGEEIPLLKPRTDESGRSDLLLLLLLDALAPDLVSPAVADLREEVEELLLEPPLRVFAILACWSCPMSLSLVLGQSV